MSMTRDVRDTAATLYYLRALDALRETHLERVLDGEDVAPDYWEQGEEEALAAMRREFYNIQVRRIFLPPEKADAVSDEEDFRARSTELAEMTMRETHRILADIPWVGHPAYPDEEASSRDTGENGTGGSTGAVDPSGGGGGIDVG